MNKPNWKKILAATVFAAAAPVMAQYADSVNTGHAVALTPATFLAPIGVNLVYGLVNLFSNPRHRN